MRENKKTRPPKIARLSHIRVTEDELEIIRTRADKAGLSVSEYVRQAALRSRIVVKNNSLDPALLASLNAIGNNLNQLTRKAHIRGQADQEKAREILEIIHEIGEKILHDPKG